MSFTVRPPGWRFVRILIVGLNFSPEPTGVGKYSGEMAEWLAARGHEVSVVTAPPYYPFWKFGEGYSGWRWRRETIGACRVTRCPIYVPARPSGLKRMIHLGSFGASALPASMLAALRTKPDIVAAIVPTLCSAPAALAAARLAGARSWIHVQDLEVDAAFDLGILRPGRMQRAVLAAERALFGRFDLVSTISEAMRERLAQKGIPGEKLALFPNWVDTETIRPMPADTAATARRQFGIPEGRMVALYSGTINEKLGLETVIDAARRLSEGPVAAPMHASVHVVIAGDGPGKARIEQEAAGLDNVTLLPLQPAAMLNEFLSIADIHLLPQRPGAAELVMPSKLGAMLASGRPVLALVAPGSPIARAIDDGGCVTPPGDAAAAAAALTELARDPTRRERLGFAARAAAMATGREKVLLQLEARLGQQAEVDARPQRQELIQNPTKRLTN